MGVGVGRGVDVSVGTRVAVGGGVLVADGGVALLHEVMQTMKAMITNIFMKLLYFMSSSRLNRKTVLPRMSGFDRQQ